MRWRIVEISGLHLEIGKTLFLLRAAHLVNREDKERLELLIEMEFDDSFSQATDMHAAISQEHTTDEAISSLPVNKRNRKKKKRKNAPSLQTQNNSNPQQK